MAPGATDEEIAAGEYICVDLHPGPGGQIGQILQFWHEGPERSVTAPSFAAWLSRLADEYEAGRWFWFKDDENKEGGYLLDTQGK